MRMYRASSLGYSLEALVAPHLGFAPMDPPEVIQRAYDEGNRLESIVLEHMLEAGWTYWDEQKEVTLEVIPGTVMVVGHIDAVGAHEPFQTVPAVVEVKTMADKPWRDFTNNGWDSKSVLIEKYKWQQSAYVLATGMPHVLVAWNKAEGAASYTYTREPFYSISDIANKLQAAEHFITAGEIPSGCEDWPCPYYYLHERKEDAVPAVVADNELEIILAAWLVADKAEKAAKKEKDTLRAQILALATREPEAGKIKGQCGVTVTTTWMEASGVSYTKDAHWETRIQGPRNGK